MDAKPVVAADAPEPQPEPLLRAAEAPHDAVVLRVEDMLAAPGLGIVASALEEKVVEFEQRSDQIQASIAEIRGVLGELQS